MNLQEIRDKQELFENNLVGTDKSLAELNTPEYALERGIIGEALEALEAIKNGIYSDEFRDEVVDILVFYATLLNHIGMSNEELENRARIKVVRNFVKYRPDVVADFPIEEGIRVSRENFTPSDHKTEPHTPA